MNNSGIYFFIGTNAELIKLFPVMRELDREQIDYSIVASGQNVIARSEMWALTSRNHELICLSDKPIRQSAVGLLIWFIATFLRSIPVCWEIFSPKTEEKSIVIIHGDTISTLMGAVLARLACADVYHIEAGLRSFNWFKPFPEEICRVLVSKMTSVSFCPNDWAVRNLLKNRSYKVDTKQNTLLDSMRYVADCAEEPALMKSLGSRYFIFIMHRQENLFDRQLVDRILDLIISKSEQINCLFVLHKPTQVALEKFNLLAKVNSAKGIITTPRLSYVSFTKVMASCEFIITDGGSNQEESYYFGKPCCVLRRETERIEGLGNNVLLSRMDVEEIRNFLDNPTKWLRAPIKPVERPSAIIVRVLKELRQKT